VYGPLPLLRSRLIGEMAVNSHSQLVSLNQTADADAEPTTRVGPPGMRGRVPRARGNQALTSAEDLSPKRHSLCWLSLFQA